MRDTLLGLSVQDRDHVVVGATPELMTRLGFRPVGRDFPVFLHPVNGEEYALARTERKTAAGYKGFQVYASPDVSLEDDLLRRDLTINAMAMDADGNLLDFHGGKADLAARVLRHVSSAFTEDPVRILRVARFAARLIDFTVAPATLALMRQMVACGEVDALVPERVWQELARGLMEPRPSRMIAVLRDCGALARVMPELDRLFGIPQDPRHHPEIDTGDHTLRVIDQSAALGGALPVRFAALCHDLGKGLTPAEHLPHHAGHETTGAALAKSMAERLRAPADCRELAVCVARWHGQAHNAVNLDATGLLALLEHTDAFRRPGRFEDFIAACRADFHGRPGYEDRSYLPAARLQTALSAASAVNAGEIARVCPANEIAAAVHLARRDAIQAALRT